MTKTLYLLKFDYLADETNKAVLDYEWVKKGLIDMYHTEVPSIFRGKGIAAILAKVCIKFFFFILKHIIFLVSHTHYIHAVIF